MEERMEQKAEGISFRQSSAVAWAALLAPAIEVLPGVPARLAGEGGWLSALIALPAALLMGWAVWNLTERGTCGLARAYCRVLGQAGGKLVLFLYIMWALALMAVRLRLGGERLLLTGQGEGGLWLFLPAAAMGLWMAWGRVAAFVRAAELFCRVLVLTPAGVILLTVFQMRLGHIWPLDERTVLPALKAALPALGVLCYGSFAGFLAGGERSEAEEAKSWVRRTAGGCLLLTAMQLAVTGNFGAELTARLEIPFLTLAKSVGVEGAFQRVEGLTAAVWIFSDLAVLGLLLWTCRRAAETIWPRCGGRMAAAVAALLALAGAILVFRDPVRARSFGQSWALLGNLILGWAAPLGVCLLSKVQEGRKKRSTSCAGTGSEKADIVMKKPPEKNPKKMKKRC